MAESAKAMLDFALRRRESNDAASPDGQIINLLRNTIAGGLRGRELAQQDASQELDRRGKVLDLQSKMQEMRAQGERDRISHNIAKAYGFVPPDPEEADAARSAALEAGAAKNPPTDVSSAGRIASLMIGGREYDAIPGFSQKSGVSLSFDDPQKGEGGLRERELKRQQEQLTKAREMAKDAARRWKFGQIQAMVGNDPLEMQKYANVQATPDEEEMFVPEALAYLEGDTYGQEKAKRSRRRRSSESLLSQLDAMHGKIADLEARGNDWKPNNEDPNELKRLTRNRANLAQYGEADLTQLRGELGAEMTTLVDKIKKGKGTPEDRARAVEIGRRIKQIGDLGGQ